MSHKSHPDVVVVEAGRAYVDVAVVFCGVPLEGPVEADEDVRFPVLRVAGQCGRRGRDVGLRVHRIRRKALPVIVVPNHLQNVISLRSQLVEVEGKTMHLKYIAIDEPVPVIFCTCIVHTI